MLNRLLAFMMVFTTLSSSSYANDSLKAAWDEFNYAVTVEWDQKDESFLNDKQMELAQAVRDANLSQTEILNFMRSEFKDEVLASEMEGLFKAVAGKGMSQKEAREALMKAMQNSQKKGASWTENWTEFGLVLVVFLGGALVFGFASMSIGSNIEN